MGEFDLLPSGQKNDIFRVTFDFYTPRAHFIVVPKSSRSKPEHLHLHLIEAAMSMLPIYSISNGILSIHRGSWKSKHKTSAFHFHLCVDVKKFLSVFEEKKREIPGWPGEQYVTKQWKASKDPSSFAVNVRGYPYSSYVEEEVDAIVNPQSTNKNEHVPKVSSGMDYRPCQSTNKSEHVPKASSGMDYRPSQSTNKSEHVPKVSSEMDYRPSQSTNKSEHVPKVSSGMDYRPSQSTNKSEHVPKVSSGMDVVYHPSQPKIGFLGRRAKSTEYLQEVFGVLEECAKHHGLTNSDSSDDDEGCHVCLYLGSPETSDWNLTQDTSSVDVVGYIVTTGTRFYQLCPLEHRKSWLQAFKLSNFKCKT